MPQVVQKIQTVTTIAAGSISVDVRADGILRGVQIASTHATGVEVSFASTSSFLTNDTASSLIGIVNNTTISSPPLEIPVQAGERVYLHWDGSAAAAKAGVWLYIDEAGGDRRPAPRRR